MTEGDDQPRLKVDRLARAMAVARTRAVDPEGDAAGTGPLPGPTAALAAAPPRLAEGAATAPLILTPDLMCAPPAEPVMPPAPAVPPVGPASAPAILRPRPLPEPLREVPAESVSAMPPGADPSLPPGPGPLPRFGPPFLSLSGVAIESVPLASVGFGVPAGGVSVLLGAPGAGASTLLRAVIGLEPLTAGRMQLDGQDITGWRPRRIARAGVGYLPGDLGLFPALSVAENLSLGAVSARPSRDRLDMVFRLFPALKPVWHRPARDLDRTGALMLALARLMAERRRLYLVDTLEMTAADPPPALLAALRELKLQGATILMAAQSLPLAAALGDSCIALAAGQVVWSGPMAVMAEDTDLQARCLGPRGGGR